MKLDFAGLVPEVGPRIRELVAKSPNPILERPGQTDQQRQLLEMSKRLEKSRLERKTFKRSKRNAVTTAFHDALISGLTPSGSHLSIRGASTVNSPLRGLGSPTATSRFDEDRR